MTDDGILSPYICFSSEDMTFRCGPSFALSSVFSGTFTVDGNTVAIMDKD